jgi:outer membrane receptor for ferrienterochelin and colicin
MTMAGPITLKIEEDPAKKSKAPALYVVDGKIVSAAALEQIRPEQIELVQVLKGKTATDKYGANAEPGVVEITTKQ